MIQFLSKAKKQSLRGTALVRLDFNTEDDWRLQATLPTLRFLLSCGSKILILSHKGRPAGVTLLNGVPRGFDTTVSLRESTRHLGKFLRRNVVFIPHFRFKEIKKTITRAPRRSIFVLENIRFLKEEQSKNSRLARTLASLADYYVNDAFAVDHHASNSVSGVPRFLPSFAGLELEQEIQFLSHALSHPAQPLILIIGGGKAKDKLMVLAYFKKKAHAFLMGGVAANTLLFLKKMNVGTSAIDSNPDDLRQFRAVLRYPNVCLPSDWEMQGGKILDIGKGAIARFEKEIGAARTIIWSGPMGLFEKKPYDTGTLAIARAIAKNRRAFSLAGGGETVTFLKKHRLDKKFCFISTGGGAMLEFLAGKKLPGIEALKR